MPAHRIERDRMWSCAVCCGVVVFVWMDGVEVLASDTLFGGTNRPTPPPDATPTQISEPDAEIAR